MVFRRWKLIWEENLEMVVPDVYVGTVLESFAGDSGWTWRLFCMACAYAPTFHATTAVKDMQELYAL